MVKKNFEGMCNRLDTITACDGRIDRRTDGRTDRQTSCHGIVRAMHRGRPNITLRGERWGLTICYVYFMREGGSLG